METKNMCTIEDYDGLRLCYMHRPLVRQELEVWHKHYLRVSVKDKNVIDGGAGCGETVKLYLEHGAANVLAIECNAGCLDNLRYNFAKDQRVRIVSFRIDMMKWDIEGAERDTVFEAHFPFRVKRLSGWPDGGTINAIVEDWGNTITKARRKAANWLRP
jgi:hypothetical protein